jgi:Domain of unknown function (DUF4249)
MKINLFCILLTGVLYSSCIKKIDPPIRIIQPKLVVEGGINTDSTSYKVRLSYSGSFSNSGSFAIVTENSAQVTITDNLGNSTPLSSFGNGFYATTSTSYVGLVGRSYQLKITLPNGDKYASIPEKIVTPVSIARIDSIRIDRNFSIVNPTHAEVMVRVNDPAATSNFYRWSGTGWNPRRATGVVCGFGCIKGEYCFQYNEYTDININSDNGINGNQIINQLAYRSPIYWYGKHYIDIKQYNISRDAFLFWKKIQEQRSRTGTTTDPLPAPVEGNVYNVNNPTELALGYFEASSISHYKAVLSATTLSPVFLSETAAFFIGVGECYLIYPNAVDYVLTPVGWSGAPEITF